MTSTDDRPHGLRRHIPNVRVKRDGYGDATREIQVTPGQNVELTVRLTTSVSPVRGFENTVKKIIGR